MKTIAIIDDDALIRKSTKFLLNDEYLVDDFESGDIFIEKINSGEINVPDLVLLDIMMPGSNGLEILNQCKSDDRLKNIPVIIVSARNETAEKAIYLESGAVDYVTKPFDFDDLRQRVMVCIQDAENN
ncbi:MAG: response regulator [Candidatus Ancillula sp.]|jgi:DNA-binding response OmpR family regulator|nr:response regulator [Candidatus Ancillula sp.]